jgi:branched-chain amino acid transport system permease protein
LNYFYHILIIFEIYLILALTMNLLAGYSGLLSLAQAAFYGIGAYSFAILLINWQVHFIIALVFSVCFNIIICIPVIYFSIRLRDLYFVLATLAWQVIIFAVLYNWVSLTKGPFGIAGIQKPELFGIYFNTLDKFLILSSVLSLMILIFFFLLKKTHISRIFQAVRDDQIVLMTFGKKPQYYKALSVFIASGITAIAGVLFATYYSYIDPTSFTLNESILIISIVLIGGLGSVKGSIAGALFYVLLPEGLRFLNMPDDIAANLRMIIYALILILVVLFRPYGFFGKYKFE